jgi:hypothetical protein
MSEQPHERSLTMGARSGQQQPEKEHHMKRTRIITLVALAVLALGAIAASAAQATEGPFWKVEGARLLAGEKHPLESQIAKEFILKSGVIEIKCTAQKLKNAELIGSTGANAGTGKATSEWENCTVIGNGAKCKLKSTTIATEPLSKTLDFANTARTGIILMFFRPVKGSVWFKIQFANDAECTIGSATVEGTFAGEMWSGGKPVEVGSEPGPSLAGEINFPAISITKDFVEVGGVLKEVIPSLKWFGKAFTFIGRSEIKLTGGQKWCVSTGAAGSKC